MLDFGLFFPPLAPSYHLTVLCSLDLQQLSISHSLALLSPSCREQSTEHSETWMLVIKAVEVSVFQRSILEVINV